MQHYASLRNRVMATCGDGGKRSRTLLDFNFVKKRKFDEEQDKNDRGSDQGKTRLCFVCETTVIKFSLDRLLLLSLSVQYSLLFLNIFPVHLKGYVE